jgi:hypothetical protein
MGEGATWHNGASRTFFGRVATWFGDLWN